MLSNQEIEKFIVDRKCLLKDMIANRELPGKWRRSYNQILTGEYLRLFIALNMLQSDQKKMLRTGRPESLFLQVRYDYENIIDLAAQTYQSLGPTTEIYLDGTEGQHSDDPYPDGKPQVTWHGYTHWIRQLVMRGVDPAQIKLTEPAYNTPQETREMLRLAKLHGWKQVTIIGNSYQLLRIALGTIQIMKKENYWLRCYFAMPDSGSWLEPMKGAQGQDDGPRYNQLLQEFERIPKYQLKGDLCSSQELVSYLLMGRDSIVDGKLNYDLN